MLTHQLAVVKRTRTEQEEVLKLVLVGVTVIEHLAEQAIGHRVTRAARELVKDLVVLNYSHIHAVDSCMHIGKTLCLLQVSL